MSNKMNKRVPLQRAEALRFAVLEAEKKKRLLL